MKNQSLIDEAHKKLLKAIVENAETSEEVRNEITKFKNDAFKIQQKIQCEELAENIWNLRDDFERFRKKCEEQRKQ